MATRSTIALEFADGTIGQVYCHWDGYLAYNGEILLASYTDPYKLRELIDHGDLSSLGADIGEKHEFSNPHTYGTPEFNIWNEEKRGVCTFYIRDRSEEGCEARYFNDYDEHFLVDGQEEEYDYILRTDGNWYVSDHGGDFVLLTEAIAKENALHEQEMLGYPTHG
jgi:hypothetical protein